MGKNNVRGAGYCKACETKREICEECGRCICDCYDCGCYSYTATAIWEEEGGRVNE